MGREGTGPISLLTVGVFTLLIVLNAGFVVGYVIMTGDEDDKDDDNGAERLVPSVPEMIIAEGEIGIRGEISLIHLYIQLYGNEGIDMRDVVVKMNCIPSDGDPIVQMFLLQLQDTPRGPGFTVEDVHDPLGTWDPEGTPASFVLSQRAQLKLTFDLEKDLVALPPDSRIEILIQVTTTGFEIIEEFLTPTAYPSSGTVRLED